MIWSKRQLDRSNRSIVLIMVICFSSADYICISLLCLFFSQNLSIVSIYGKRFARATIISCARWERGKKTTSKKHQIEFDSHSLPKVLINISSRDSCEPVRLCQSRRTVLNHNQKWEKNIRNRYESIYWFVIFIIAWMGWMERWTSLVSIT